MPPKPVPSPKLKTNASVTSRNGANSAAHMAKSANADRGGSSTTPKARTAQYDDQHLSDIEDDEVNEFVTSPDEDVDVSKLVGSALEGQAAAENAVEARLRLQEAQEKQKQEALEKQAAKARRENIREANRQDLATPLGRMEGKERSGEGLRKRINARNTALLTAMGDILDATTELPNDKRDNMTVMSRQLRTQFSTQQMVRSCEDLLTLVRWMQERWLCGNLNTIGQSTVEGETDKDAKAIVELLKRLDGGPQVEHNTEVMQ